jgi:hypothetical protein
MKTDTELPRQSSPSDRRAETRHAVRLEAELIWNAGSGRQACVIRDLSVNGAKVETRFFVDIPKRVFLLLKDSARLLECEVRWQLGTEMGLFFLDEGGKSMRRVLIQQHTQQEL